MKRLKVFFSLIISLMIINSNFMVIPVKAEDDVSNSKKIIVVDPKVNLSGREFSIITDRQFLPLKVQSDILNLKNKRGYYVFDNEEYGLKDDKSYILISSGEKPAGFNLTVENVENKDGNVVINVKENTPNAINAEREILAFPNVLIRLEKKYTSLSILNSDGEEIKSMLQGNAEAETIEDLDGMSDKVKSKIDSLKNKSGYFVFKNDEYDIKDENFYVLVCNGESAYGTTLSIKSVDNSSKKTVITIVENEPEKVNDETYEKSYPFLLLKIKEPLKEITINKISNNSLGILK